MPTTQQDTVLRIWLEGAHEDLSRADRSEQEAILDAAFRACGCDPTWAEWQDYARHSLPAYRPVPVKPQCTTPTS